jgi:hypothetical protein
MRPYAILLSAFLLTLTSNQPFAQDSKEERAAIALARSPGATAVVAPVTAEQRASLPLCLGFVVFEAGCDVLGSARESATVAAGAAQIAAREQR